MGGPNHILLLLNVHKSGSIKFHYFCTAGIILVNIILHIKLLEKYSNLV